MDPRDIIELHKPPTHELVEQVEEISLYPNDPERVVKIGTSLNSDVHEAIIQTLGEFADIFAWTPKDMPGLPTEIALHRLNIKPGVDPVK